MAKAYQVKNGSCKRGEKLRKTYVPEFRGALCVDTVASHIVTISLRKIENFFNRVIQNLAKEGLFPKTIKAAGDCTLYETTAKFTGCGTVTHKRRVTARGRRKNGELKEVKVTLYGWKVWAIYEIERVWLFCIFDITIAVVAILFIRLVRVYLIILRWPVFLAYDFEFVVAGTEPSA